LPYHTHSAFYPLITHLERRLQFTRDEPVEAKIAKLEQWLKTYRFPQPETLPLIAALLSVPLPEGHSPPLRLGLQQQRQRTQATLDAWLMEEAERQPLLAVWEDLHWMDPSTLEVLGLLIDHTATGRMLTVLTARPEFQPPWEPRGSLTVLTLRRLELVHVEAIVQGVTRGKALPAAILAQIVEKTDGVPLFVEELTKAIVESGMVRAVNGYYELTALAGTIEIPLTLQDSLMARLDRLGAAKRVAQVGAVIGREFSPELLEAVTPHDRGTVQRLVDQLVAAELLFPHESPQATYVFKHALIRDAAYQSLLRRTRQQYHQRIAQVLSERFPETVETQPEVLAHHFTEAGLSAQALSYWQRAGERATQRSAHMEAVNHLTKGLEILRTLPHTPEHTQQELMLQVALGAPLMATKGWAAPEVEQVCGRARELCQQAGESVQLFPVLWGLWNFYIVRAQVQTAQELGEQFLRLAQNTPDPAFLLQAHFIVGDTFFWCGEFPPARAHLEQDIALDNPQRRCSHAALYGLDPGIACLSHAAWTLWVLGYPEQALKRAYQALTVAKELSHPLSVAWALWCAGVLHRYRQERQAAQEQAEALITLATEQEFPHWVVLGTLLRGWAVTEQGQREEEIEPMRQSIATWRAMGAELDRPHCLALLAEAWGTTGQPEEGLAVLDEALAAVHRTGEHYCEANLYRLVEELSLQLLSPQSTASDPRPRLPNPQAEAEACFHQAIAIARRQSAKSFELRASMSLARLWQQEGKRAEAYELLAPIYGWFTEGFDTADLQEAKALLVALR
jgi:predicted ATPase